MRVGFSGLCLKIYTKEMSTGKRILNELEKEICSGDKFHTSLKQYRWNHEYSSIRTGHTYRFSVIDKHDLIIKISRTIQEKLNYPTYQKASSKDKRAFAKQISKQLYDSSKEKIEIDVVFALDSPDIESAMAVPFARIFVEDISQEKVDSVFNQVISSNQSAFSFIKLVSL